MSDNPIEGAIAIVGMAGRFPGARDLDQFWQNLRDGIESITIFSEQELLTSGVDAALLQRPDYIRAHGIVEDIEYFDAAFFDMTPRQAEITDPQHRLFLECAWEALEHAGYDPHRYTGHIGMYASTSVSTYLQTNVFANQEILQTAGRFQINLGNDKDFLSTRVSYKLGLTGPSMSIQTACSSSLVAICLACQSLLTYQSDMALAGGVSINVPQQAGYLYQEGGIASSDGHCRAFDSQASGTVAGNGLGVVVLKRMEDALSDGDVIHALIRGSALNNDGLAKVGYTAPSVDGQAEVVATAQAFAEVEAESITYVETHGTGTQIGDPIEIAALTQAFRLQTQRQGFCALGSVKTNIGHLDAAAGVAGLLKTILALKHKQIPPSLHFVQPNPHLGLANSPFYVNAQLTAWTSENSPRRAGVSAFGIGGTNAHVILEEAPLREEITCTRSWHILPLSARTSSALNTAIQRLADALPSISAPLHNIAYTLQVGRTEFNQRCAVIGQQSAEIVTALHTRDPRTFCASSLEPQQCKVVFLFPGQGTQYVHMGRDLYDSEPHFRLWIDQCAQLFQAHLHINLLDLLYPPADQLEQAQQQLTQTALTQPALFTFEYALAKLWLSWGIEPHAMLGHSIGEYVAACLAGVLSLEDAVALVAVRGKLIQALPTGAMLAVASSAQQVQPLLGETLSLAAVNSPTRCVVAGPMQAIEQLHKHLTTLDMSCQRLHVSHAFHSTMMDTILETFLQHIKQIKLHAPRVPYVSNVSGTWITEAEVTDPTYWSRHLRQTVNFSAGVTSLLHSSETGQLFLEVGPGQTLSTLVKQHLPLEKQALVVSSLDKGQDRETNRSMALALSQCWLAGMSIDWDAVYQHESRQRVPLPTYPFERQRYWVEPQPSMRDLPHQDDSFISTTHAGHRLSQPLWKQKPLQTAGHGSSLLTHTSCWLLLCDQCGIGSALTHWLRQQKQQVIEVQQGERFTKLAEECYTLNPSQSSDYDLLFDHLRTSQCMPQEIIHCCLVTAHQPSQPTSEQLWQNGYNSLLFLVQVLDRQHYTQSLCIRVISDKMQAVLSEERISSDKASILELCKTITWEYAHITCRSIDLLLPPPGSEQERTLLSQLAEEISNKSSASVVAYRGSARWVQEIAAVHGESTAHMTSYGRAHLGTPHVAPRNQREQMLVEIWEKLLGIQHIGVHDHFMELGGDSLLAIQVISRIRTAFHVDLSVRHLFEAQTVAALASWIEQQDEQDQKAFAPLLQKDAHLEEIPLSFAQQRLWFLEQFESGNDVYHLALNWQLTGPLHLAALERSIQEIIARHQTLRTSFSQPADVPIQVIAPLVAWSFPVIDLRNVPFNEQEELLQQLLLAGSRQPFHLTQGPLLRVLLLHLDNERYIMQITLHHIIADGWSQSLFCRELNVLYPAFCVGAPSSLPALPIQYTDYVHWQRAQAQVAIHAQQLGYWQQQLADLPPLVLPTDYQRPVVQRFQGQYLRFQLPLHLTEALKQYSQRQSVTLFMTLLAAFQMLLACVSGQEDLAVGTPIANRTNSEVEELIGLFVNTLVLRLDLSGNPSLNEVVARVRATTLAAYAHQDLPFEHLVEALNPERRLNAHPLFQVMFVLQNTPAHPLELTGVRVEQIRVKHHISMFDLTLNLFEHSEGISGGIEYDLDLFTESRVKRLLGLYQQILEEMVSHPEQRLSALPLLTAAERAQLQVWEAPRQITRYSPDTGVHTLFEQQMAATPDMVALVYEQEQMTYQELNSRANQLAHYLRSLGVAPETCVGIYLERSLELGIALLGVLKAGGTYVPIDPTYPAERCAFLLQDAHIGVLLTCQELSKNLSQSSVPQIICLDTAGTELHASSSTNPDNQTDQQNAAYILYTSGSTGQPKGTVISHQALLCHQASIAKAYDLSPTDRVLQFSSISFDVAYEEIFPSWLHGATVVLRPASLPPTIPDFLKLVTCMQLTVLNLPPAYWQNWLVELQHTLLPCPSTLRLIIVGSDLVYTEQLLNWQKQISAPLRWLHAYGLTETTITTTLYEPSVELDAIHQPTVPIGRVLPHAQAFVLNAHLQAVSIGVPGELYIGGTALARGYLHQPALTAERFLPHPFSQQPGERLYKTGDLVRYHESGNLEFLGRIDQQIKLRGFRIELNEVESVIRQYPQIQDVVVLLYEAAPGDKRLVAYVIPSNNIEFSTHDLRTHVQEYLPAYMVPAAFVSLPSFPRTLSGKLNRQALPAPVWEIHTTRSYAEPRTPEEIQLAHIWVDVLHLERIDIHTNFFEVGGDSILSLMVIARARQTGLIFTPRQLFQYPTIAGLLAVAKRAIDDTHEHEEIQGAVPLTPIQTWFFEQNLSSMHHWNQAICLEAPHRLLIPAFLRQSIAQLIEQHDALRLRFLHRPHGWEQSIASDNVPIDTLVRTLDLSTCSAEEQEHAFVQAAEETQMSLDLTTGPLLRALHVIRCAPEPDLLLIVIHHLVIDGVSWRILLEDLQSIYDQLVRKVPIALPPKTTSFKRWSERLTIFVSSPDLQRETAYWLATRQQYIPTLPLDFSAPSTGVNTVASQEHVRVLLEAAVTHELLQDVPKVYHTHIDEILLTALVLTCTPWLGQACLLLDVEGHGREALFEDVDVSRTVGWFTSIFPLFLDLRNVARHPVTQFDLGQAIKTVKEQVRGVPQHGIGYGILRYLHPDPALKAQLAAPPWAQISFNYLGQFQSALSSAEGGLFSWASVSPGPLANAQGQRSHMLEIDAAIMRDQLQIQWSFSTRLHNRATIETLAQRYIETLQALIAHCRAAGVGGYTPADFPDLALSQARLDKVMNKLRSVQKKATS